MAGWHHWLNGHEFEQTPGVGDGQGSLACCSPRGHKESDTTEHWKELNWLNLRLTQLVKEHSDNLLILQSTDLDLNYIWKNPFPAVLWLEFAWITGRKCVYTGAGWGPSSTLALAEAENRVWKERRKKVKSLSCVWLFATPLTVACQAPPSMGFSRQEYWSGVPSPEFERLGDIVSTWRPEVRMHCEIVVREMSFRSLEPGHIRAVRKLRTWISGSL